LASNTTFRDPILKRVLKTFSIKTKVSKTDKKTILKVDRHVFVRLLVLAQFRQLNMRDAIRYELGHIPWSIATTGGCLVKTNKAALSSIIEKSAEHNGVLQNRSAWICDAMALIQSLKNIFGLIFFGGLSGENLNMIFYQNTLYA
jgi:hypothetical protein